MDYQIYNLNLEYCRASMGKRFANYIIDAIASYIIMFFLGFSIEILFPGSISGLQLNGLEDRLLGISAYGLIMFLIEAAFQGKSLGKLITGTKAVNINGSTLTIEKALLRNFIRAVPFNGLSALGTPCKPWHDSWSNTIVIDEAKVGLQERKADFFVELNEQTKEQLL